VLGQHGVRVFGGLKWLGSKSRAVNSVWKDWGSMVRWSQMSHVSMTHPHGISMEGSNHPLQPSGVGIDFGVSQEPHDGPCLFCLPC
jgi:hypothetical protein